jgi:hypothetical protein
MKPIPVAMTAQEPPASRPPILDKEQKSQTQKLEGLYKSLN